MNERRKSQTIKSRNKSLKKKKVLLLSMEIFVFLKGMAWEEKEMFLYCYNAHERRLLPASSKQQQQQMNYIRSRICFCLHNQIGV